MIIRETPYLFQLIHLYYKFIFNGILNITIKMNTIYVALLRGITPGNPNMRNEKLRGVFEELGFTNVRSLISSGNIIFESASDNTVSLEDQIEKAINEKLGFKSTTIIRSKDQLQKLLDNDPFNGTEHTPTTQLNVTFLKNDSSLDFQLPYKVPGKVYMVLAKVDDAICTSFSITDGKTPDLMVWLEKRFTKEITTRTWKTVQRIVKAME